MSVLFWYSVRTWQSLAEGYTSSILSSTPKNALPFLHAKCPHFWSSLISKWLIAYVPDQTTFTLVYFGCFSSLVLTGMSICPAHSGLFSAFYFFCFSCGHFLFLWKWVQLLSLKQPSFMSSQASLKDAIALIIYSGIWRHFWKNE